MISIVDLQAARYRWRALSLMLRNDTTLQTVSTGVTIHRGDLADGHFTEDFINKTVWHCGKVAEQIGGMTSLDKRTMAQRLKNF